MKKIFKPLAAVATVVLLAIACKKNDNQTTETMNNVSDTKVSQEVLGQIKNLGFGTGSVQKVADGYLVEGDILLTPEHLQSHPVKEFLRVGDVEQYRTSNTVLGLPRTVTVQVSTALPAVYVTAVNAAIARYNALGLTIKFSRVTAGGEILINPAPAGATYLASAGFPFDSGNPYNQILVNATTLNTWAANTRTSVIAHEMGHCIGMRHTDYYNRAISCGGAVSNEGDAGVGAKLIPGTPSSADANSWMLACIGNGVDRPFTANDKIALNWLY